MHGKLADGMKGSITSAPNRLFGLRRQSAVQTRIRPSDWMPRSPQPSTIRKEEKRASPQRGPDPVHFRTESAPELPTYVRPSAREVQRLQAFRREHRHFKDGDFRQGPLRGGRSADWVWVMSLPGGTRQKELRVDLAPSMTAYDLAEAARRAWGWGVDDELRLYFLGAELHPLWLLEDCGVQDLCQLRILRRRAAVHSHPVDL